MAKSKLVSKEFMVVYNSQVTIHTDGSQGRNSGQEHGMGTEAEAMEEH